METRDANNRVARVPFVVYAGDQRIEVLGTNFNVNAYKDEQRTATTLVSGKVEVSWDEDPNRRVTLEPGQFASTDRGGLVSGRAHLESVIAWKNNHFYFNDQHISSIMRQLSRWYDVD